MKKMKNLFIIAVILVGIPMGLMLLEGLPANRETPKKTRSYRPQKQEPTSFSRAELVSLMQATEVKSISRHMSFDRCLTQIRDMATSLQEAPINIMETSQMRMVRWMMVDGSFLITCSKPDNKIVLTKSPYQDYTVPAKNL